ncbi:MAG: LysE family translocator [Alphaproteobacteria bacterium]
MRAFTTVMTPDLLLAFATFTIVSSITPGPNNLMLMASGTNFGVRRTMPHFWGVILGFTALILLVGLGLSQVFVRFPIAHVVLKVLSALYMLYLAWKIATAPPPSESQTQGKPMTFVQALMFQWVNPKGWSMALTAVSAYVVGYNVWGYVLVALVLGMTSIVASGLWMLTGARLRRFLANPRALRTFNIVMALLLVASLYPVLFSH